MHFSFVSEFEPDTVKLDAETMVHIVTYIDTGCRWVELLSRNGFLRFHDWFYREGREQEGFLELPFDSGCPKHKKNKLVKTCTTKIKSLIFFFKFKSISLYLLAGSDDFTRSVLYADFFQWDSLFLHLGRNERLPVSTLHFDQANL